MTDIAVISLGKCSTSWSVRALGESRASRSRKTLESELASRTQLSASGTASHQYR